jgi:hypothetical protein
MRKPAILISFAPVFGIGIYLACASLTCSQVNKTEPPSYQSTQKSTPKKAERPLLYSEPATGESTHDQETTHLEPIRDKIVKPQAKIVAPANVNVKSYVVLDFAGTVSSIEPDFDVVFSPDGSVSHVTKLYNKSRSLVYGLFIPEKAGKYRIALVAFATDGGKADTLRSYAFVDIDVTEPGKPPPEPQPPGPLPTPGPLPVPPGPEPPLTPPKPKQEDTYGMYAFTKDLLSQMPPGDPWQIRIPLIYDSFDKMIAQSSSFTDATRFVQATSDLYKSALGKDYPYFSYYFFTPLKTQLGQINSSGKLPSTVEAHVEAWKEISRALHEVKIPVASPVRSHR